MSKKRDRSRPNTMAGKIVSLTIFLDAVFLVLVMAVLTFIYIDNIEVASRQQMESESLSTKGSIEAFVTNGNFDVATLASDQAVIDYLLYLNEGNAPIINDVDDPDYLLYHSFAEQIDSLYQFSNENVYNFVFLATAYDCSTGSDGCYVGIDDEISDAEWNLAERQWYIDLQETDSVLSDPYIDDLTGEYAITFASKVYNGDTVIGYVGIDVLLSGMQNVFTAYDYSTDQSSRSVSIFDLSTEPVMLYHSDVEMSEYVMANETKAEVLDSGSGHADDGLSQLYSTLYVSEDITTLNLFGTDYRIMYNDIEGTDWVVALILESQPIFGLEMTFLIIVGGIMVLMIFVSLILSNNIRRTLSPIDDILKSIEEIKRGNYNINVRVKENNELRHVADALNIMSREIGKQVELVYQSFVYDSLTGLKNRKASHQEIDEILKGDTDKTAICLLEVDNLKSINVTKGQSVSEELLKGVANRLRKTVSNSDHLFSNGGNEFVFLITGTKSLERAESEVSKIIDSFIEPLDVGGIKIEVAINAGISIYPSDGRMIVDLVKKADIALFKARQDSRNSYVFYNDQLTKEVSYKAQISEQLAQAIKNEQLYLKYQPLIGSDNEVYGFEALVRWKSPTLGEISPQIFVANAEESHLIIPIGNWILHRACEAQVKMKQMFDKKFVMSVNVSPIQLMQKDFIDVLKRIIRDTEIDPKYLVLEITEGVLIESSFYLEEIIDYLHEIGARIALDDFGTGYASLTYLKQIPFDNLKIDKSFVDGIFGPKKDHSIIATIVQLVHNLDMKVIAEGVEKRKQYEYLKQISTDVFQGYLFSKPLLFDDAVHYVDQFYKVAKNKRIDVFASKDYFE
ncbi:MAG: EAL domain-containing protein [Bacilli bacterium]|nr:EAL domain-containing protein [Bacilli bacterium]